MMHRPRFVRRASGTVAAMLAVALAGCQTVKTVTDTIAPLNPLAASEKIGELPPKPADRVWPDAAKDVRNERARGMGLVEMPELQAYLNGLLAKIREAAGVREWPGKVYITASSDLQAYSTAAGNVYLSVGWLQVAESEDEIVAIMAHELGHIYRDTQKLDSVLATGNEVAGLAVLGVALAHQAGVVSTKWGPADNLATAYVIGRGSLAPAWSRKEEDAADRFGVTVSMRLDYSFPRGFKAFLEQQASWESDNAARKEAERLQLNEQRKKDAEAKLRPKSGPARQGEPDSAAQMQVGIEQGKIDMSMAVQQGIDSFLSMVTANHPSTQARLESLTEQVGPLLEGKPRPSARIQPWTQAREQRRTAAILKNYEAILKAQEALGKQEYAQARQFALASISGPTAQHALPNITFMAMEASTASLSPGRSRPARRPNPRAASPLDRNIQSEPDRAWQVYVMRANALLETGQAGPAKVLMSQGFAYFSDAPAAWADEVSFVGRTEGWDQAKKLAQTCATRFPTYAAPCIAAAVTPAEEADQKRRDDLKNEDVKKRLQKKVS